MKAVGCAPVRRPLSKSPRRRRVRQLPNELLVQQEFRTETAVNGRLTGALTRTCLGGMVRVFRMQSAAGRLACALLAVWSVLCLAEATQLHACPTHDAPLAAVQTAMTHGAHSHHTPQSQHNADHHQCTCIGACAPVALAAAAPAPPDVRSGAGATRLIASATSQHAPLRVAYLLPFSNAPPTAL